MYMRKANTSGFTLLELIIVIAIIGIISAIVMVALSDSREHSRNTARVAQIKEYQKAFNLYYSDTGYYPKFGVNETNAWMCLGDYPDDRCWQNGGTGTIERETIANAIVPKYMGQMPKGETIMFGQGGNLYEGMIYTHANYGKSYKIQYIMEGSNKSCILDGATGSNLGGSDFTLCTLVVTP